MLKTEKRGITKSEKKIMKAMLTGPKWYYQLYKGKNKVVGSNTTALEALKHLSLSELGLIKSTKEATVRGRRRRYYSLTFKGLVFLLKEGIINNENVSKIRKQLNIELPVLPIFDSLVINIEKYFPDAFYKLLACVDIERMPEDLLLFFTSTSAFYTLLFQFDYNSDSIKNWMEEKNAGSFDNLEALNMLTPMLKPFQDFFENVLEEKNKKRC